MSFRFVAAVPPPLMFSEIPSATEREIIVNAWDLFDSFFAKNTLGILRRLLM
jgi:hypothetical protein